MTVDNLLYATGAAFDVFGALLIVQGFYNISDEDIKDFSANVIGPFSQGRAKSMIRQRYEAMFGGGFIVFGSALMLIASILSFQVSTEQYPDIFINRIVPNLLGVFIACIVPATFYLVSYKWVIEYLCEKKLDKIVNINKKPDITE